MVRAWWFSTFLIGALVAIGCRGGTIDHSPAGGVPETPRRIVSLAPSLTETLFALGLGDRVVGVTRYCAHPEEVRVLPRVGGHLDPNFEAIVALEPDLVVVIPSSHENRRRLESLAIPVLEVDQHDVASILESVSVVAEACGVPEQGSILRAEIEFRLNRVASAVVDAPRPRTLVVVGHQAGGTEVRTVWAAGRDTFYDGVVVIAGGVNALEEGVARYPELSREGLAVVDPDVVLDVIAGLEQRGLDIDRVRAGWLSLSELRAARERRVYVLEGDYMVVPGPRLPKMVEVMARAIHPELDWGEE